MFRKKRAEARACLLVAVLLVSGLSLDTGCGTAPDDTGFVGTWERRLPGGYSSLSIRQEDAGYVVRWSKLNGAESVRCDEQGRCEEFVGETKVCDWQFQAFVRPDSDDLFVEVVGTPLDPATPALRYVDRLRLESGGIELWSYSVSENGADLDPEQGPRVFKKVSDRPL